MTRFDCELDASGLNCPLPILKARKALAGLSSGEVLQIISTDPGSMKDFEAFCRHTGNDLLENWEEAGRFFFVVKKK